MNEMIDKITIKPGSMVYPLPAVMVSMGQSPDEYNIITISWTGTLNSTPPKCYISIRPGRFSYQIIKRTMEFVINLTNSSLTYATDWCGMHSGRDFDKFKEMNLTPMAAQIINAPIIAQSPVNIECKVTQIIPLGSHDMFMADIVAISMTKDDSCQKDEEFQKIIPDLINYSNGHYFKQGESIGKYGFSKKTDNI